MSNINEKLEKIIMEIMETDEPIKVDADLYNDVGMESIEIVELFVAIDKAFGVKVPDSLYSAPKCIESLAQYIEKNKNLSAAGI